MYPFGTVKRDIWVLPLPAFIWAYNVPPVFALLLYKDTLPTLLPDTVDILLIRKYEFTVATAVVP